MSSRSSRAMLLWGAVAVLAVSPGAAAAADSCQGAGAIDDRGGEAVGTCPGSGGNAGSTVPVRGSRGGVVCTEERAAVGRHVR